PEIGKELISIRIFPKPYLIELLKNGKISIEELVKRRNRIEGYKFNPDSEADLIIEYSRLIFHLNKFSKKDIDKLIMPFEEFKKLSTKKHEEIPEIEKYEMDSLAYENLVVKNKIIKELLGQGRKLEIIGNTSLGLFYSLPLKLYFKGRKDVNFSISRVSSTDMHEREVFLKRELFDKSQLDNIIRKQMTTVVLDATTHKRMPDGLKGYRNYFAALDLMILRKMKNKKSNDADDIKLVAELTNQGVEVVEVILDELEKSGLDKVFNKWIFMIPTEKLRLYRIYDYDLDESGRYRTVREEVGDYTHTHGIGNTLPEKESKEIPVVLVQCSVKGKKVPILLVKEGDMHKKGFFDDKDNFRMFALSFDDKGVHLNLEGVSKEISKRMANLESKTKQNR
ncbi:hypothetical protein J7J26_02095, partial [Candidatus Micrarchaeota archaeon]|nr:hypothetical protein [Candidatus Micrarchaeota archaeon]